MTSEGCQRVVLVCLVGREGREWRRDGLCVLAGTVQLDESTRICTIRINKIFYK